MIFLNIGEPDFTAPPLVLRRRRALPARRPHPVHRRPPALPALRERIAAWYGDALRPDGGPGAHRRHRRRVGGAAAGLPGAVRGRRRGADARPQLPLQPPLRRRRRRHARGCCRPRPTPASSSTRRRCAQHWTAHTRGVLLASPSNPTGTSIAAAEMAAIVQAVRARGGVTLVDEIYLGLSYDEAYGHSALAPGRRRHLDQQLLASTSA